MHQDAGLGDPVGVFALDGEVVDAVGAGNGPRGDERDAAVRAVELFADLQFAGVEPGIACNTRCDDAAAIGPTPLEVRRLGGPPRVLRGLLLVEHQFSSPPLEGTTE